MAAGIQFKDIRRSQTRSIDNVALTDDQIRCVGVKFTKVGIGRSVRKFGVNVDTPFVEKDGPVVDSLLMAIGGKLDEEIVSQFLIDKDTGLPEFTVIIGVRRLQGLLP